MKRIYNQLVVFLLFVISFNLYSQQYTEYELKAVYIYHFAKFIKWPPDSTTSVNEEFRIGLYGDNLVFSQIIPKVLKGKLINNKQWKIKQFYSIDDIEDCDILFVSQISKYDLIKLIDKVEYKGILTVGDNITKFCQLGGMINFTNPEDQYSFDINHFALKRNDLIISSKLLSISRIVEDERKIF